MLGSKGPGLPVLVPARWPRWHRLQLFVRHFTPSWMVITMGTGSLAITLELFPFHFSGQQGIAFAIWALNLALFITFLCLLLSRAVCYPASARELLEQPNQSLFLGTLPMSISVITGGVVAVLVPRCQEPALKAAYTLAWANVPIVVVVALLVPIYMFSVHDYNMLTMTSLWLVPVIPGTAAAAVTGAVSKVTLHHDQAVALLYPGLCMLAVGFALSYHVLNIYYQRLVCHNLPPREVIVSTFIPVGATGMAGWALLQLATAAELHVRAYYEARAAADTSLPSDDAWLNAVLPTCMAGAGVLGLCLWAYAGWWLVLAVCSVGQTLRQGIPFTLGWWGAIFPLGTYAGTTLALANTFQSPAFKVMGAVAAVCQTAVWLFVGSMTVYHGWAGQLFHPPCLSAPQATFLEPDDELPAAAVLLEQRLEQPRPVVLTASALGTLRHRIEATKHLEGFMSEALVPGGCRTSTHSKLVLPVTRVVSSPAGVPAELVSPVTSMDSPFADIGVNMRPFRGA